MSTTKYTDRTQLSPREAEIHVLKSQGLSNEQIADMLHLKEGTVAHHVRSVNMRKQEEKAEAKTQRIRLIYEFDVTCTDNLSFRVETIFDHIESFDSVRLVKSHAELVDLQEEKGNNDRTAIQSVS